MISFTCTPERDSANSYPKKCISINVYDKEICISLTDPDRKLRLSEEDSKELLKLLTIELSS